MPIAKIKLPNGKVGRFNVPEGMATDAVLSYVNNNLDSFKEPEPEVKKIKILSKKQDPEGNWWIYTKERGWENQKASGKQQSFEFLGFE